MKKHFLFLLILLFLASPAYAEECEVNFFYSQTCPYCMAEKPFLQKLENFHPGLKVNYLLASENYELFEKMSDDYGSIPAGVPRTFVGDKVFIGFDENPGELDYSKGYEAYIGYKNQIEAAVLDCIGSGQVNQTSAGDGESSESILMIVPLLLISLYLIFVFIFKNRIDKRYLIGTLLGLIIVILFYFSQHLPKKSILSFAEHFSFPVFTSIIALLDGFNPCAFAVLSVLLSLLIYARSRAKMALIGAIFILTSGIMYFLFIMVLMVLRSQLFVGHKEIIRIIVGVIALTAGTINLKDFFFFKKGVSLTISSEKMSKLTSRMREVVDKVKKAETGLALFIAILATMALAVLVNIIELGCTLILPVEYIEVLITNYGTQVGSVHYLYTLLYSGIYVIPLFAILGIFLYSFKSMRVKQMQGRVLKLISGLVMVGLGLILIFKPELLAFA